MVKCQIVCTSFQSARLPGRASKPCCNRHPRQGGGGPRSPCPAWCSTSASSLVTRPQREASSRLHVLAGSGCRPESTRRPRSALASTEKRGRSCSGPHRSRRGASPQRALRSPHPGLAAGTSRIPDSLAAFLLKDVRECGSTSIRSADLKPGKQALLGHV